MKQELPLAALLLATGFLLWWFGGNRENGASQPTTESISAGNLATDAPVQAVGYQQEAAPVQDAQLPRPDSDVLAEEQQRQEQAEALARKQLNAIQLGEAELDFDETEAPLAAFLHARPDRRAVEWLGQMARNTAESRPLGTSLQLAGRLLGATISAKGRYFQAGQGTHKTRLELDFGTDQDASTLYHLCDGRFVYRLQRTAREQNLEFIDLTSIQNLTNDAPTAYSPTGWIATGGVPSMLQHLGSAFHFGAPQSLDGKPLPPGAEPRQQDWIIRGCWSREALQRMLGTTHPEVFGESDTVNQPSVAPIVWSGLPAQLPHGVELHFTPSPLTGCFLKKVSFIRFAAEALGSSRLTPQVMVHVAFSPPRTLTTVTDRMFRIDTKDVESVDATSQVLARIQSLEENRWAATQENRK